MAKLVNLRLVIKHLTNGTLGESLCIICLEPLNDRFENIFTRVCKENDEFCVADVLKAVAHLEFSENDNYNVCIDCFTTSYLAYKFYFLSSRTNAILNYYCDELTSNINNVEFPDEIMTNSLFITLPTFITETTNYNFNLNGIGSHIVMEDISQKLEIGQIRKIDNDDDDKIVFVIQENGEPLFFRIGPHSDLVLLTSNEKKKYRHMQTLSNTVLLRKAEVPKIRKKRRPLTHKSCSRCPVKYRFSAKLKEHMKTEHNVELFICKICSVFTEDQYEYYDHMQSHTNIYQCAICHTVFKKRDTIINHLKWHDKMKNISQREGAHICEICGVITEDENSLHEHYDMKHYKRYTCYYCGRLYKGEQSYGRHIKKHEAHLQATGNIGSRDISIKQPTEPSPKDASDKHKCICPTCGALFVDERALMWHQRLHNDERPYKCEVCGRAFVSVNRRNQHALCAHTAPTKRCPLCPALFHLRSMVNTHIKKVHLKTHKRRNRVSKHQNAYWRTEPVPIQDLGIDIQNDILELQAANKQHRTFNSTQVMENVTI